MQIRSKYDGRCKACKTSIYKGQLISWTREHGARHLTSLECDQAKAAEPKPAPQATLNAKPIVAFLGTAKANGLKWPKASFLHEGQVIRLSVSGPDSRVPGSVQVKLDDEWIGRVEPDGSVYGHRLSSDEKILDTLARIANEPAKVASEYGSFSGQCSFCSKTLTDAGSIEVGYGPVCAAKYDLPHKPKGSVAPKEIRPEIQADVDSASLEELEAAADIYDVLAEVASIQLEDPR